MDLVKGAEYYIDKLEDIAILEKNNYRELIKEQDIYKEKLEFYNDKKDTIGIKLRMLEVYQGLWENIELEINQRSFLNEEFWNNINFNIIKYEKFIQELEDYDYNKQIKEELDISTNRENWIKREEYFQNMKNDISNMSSNYNRMHQELYQRTLKQRECIERHITNIKLLYQQIEDNKDNYRRIFHNIQRDLGIKGNKISVQSLNNYKISIIRKLENVDKFEDMDIAW